MVYNDRRYLDVAIGAAVEAGDLLERSYQRVEAREKGPNDLVTEADFASQRRIKEIVRNAFPDHDFLGEEEEPDERISPFRWLVDPLDGTINFAHGVEPWCVSIALEYEHDLIAGVVYVPLTKTMFSAARGAGAFENGRPIRVSKACKLSSALVAAGMPTRFAAEAQRQLAIMGRLSTGTHGVRRMGSSAWNLAKLAAGGFDVCYATSVHSWDVAAGVLLVREAGGNVTNLAGESFEIDRPELVATNGLLHEETVLAVAQAWPRTG